MKQLYYKILENVEALLIGLLVVVMPIIFFRKVLDPVLFPRYLALSIWVLIMLFVLGYKTWKGKFNIVLDLPHKIIFGAAALFVLLNAVASFDVVNSNEAIFKTFKEFTLVLSFFVFFQVLKNNDKAINIVVKSVIISALIFIGIGVKQLLDADFTQFKAATSDYGYWFRQATAHVKSTLASPNPFASFLVLSIAFSTYGSVMFKKIWRLMSIITVLASVAFILVLGSKASYGSLGIAVVVGFLILVINLFYIVPKKQGKQVSFWGRYLVLLMPFVFFIAGFYVVEKLDIGFVNVLVDKVTQVLDPEESKNAIYNSDNPTSTQTRTFAWAQTIQMARDNPWLGVGPGQWRIVYPKYGLDPFEWTVRNGKELFQRAHNDFLWILSEVGFVGFFLFLTIFFGTLIIAIKNILASNKIENIVLNGLMFSILIGFIVNLFVSFPRERIAHNVAYLLMLALILSTVKGSGTYKAMKKQLLLICTAVLILLAGFNTRIAIDMVKGDNAAAYIKFGLMKNNVPVIARGVRMVDDNSFYTLDPFSAPIPYYKAIVAHRQNNIEDAKKEFLKAYQLHPYHLMNLVNLGTACNKLGDNEGAFRYYDEALSISPRFEEALMAKAIVQHTLSNSKQAVENIGKIPISSKNPANFEHTYITICKKRGIDMANQLNITKLKAWLSDENKIKATFVKFQQGNGSFDKILLQELGK